MSENDKPILIYSTFPSAREAREIGDFLVAADLAACVNILPGMSCIYRWKGSINCDEEVVMIVKTRVGLSEQVQAAIIERHSYEVPAIIEIAVAGGSQPFLDWVVAESRGPQRSK